MLLAGQAAWRVASSAGFVGGSWSGASGSLAFVAFEELSAWLRTVPVVIPAVCVPALAMLLGGFAAGRFALSTRGLCASQYFSAGMILAVCGALVQEVTERGAWASVIFSLGFSLGVAAMVTVKKLSEGFGAGPDEMLPAVSPSGREKVFPWPLLAAVAIDSFVDGLLLGMIGVEAPHTVGMMAFATALEMGALGLSFSADLRTRSKPAPWFLSVVGMPLVLMLGGCIGAAAAGILRNSPLAYTFWLAFGLAALLYLVTRELLVEAEEHRQEAESGGGGPTSAPLCLFVGYLLVLVIGIALE